MQTYIGLLRGINVGGKRIIAMPQLKLAFEEAGFADVRTYINSGNVLFSAEETDTLALQHTCRQLIADRFDLDIPTAVISADALANALANAPSWWGDDPDAKHNAIFVIAPTTAASVIADIGEAKPVYERVAHCGSVIFWSAPIATFSHTRWSKVSSTAAYAHITIRNANTAKKLLTLARQ